jgi:hypothetical protein
MQIAGLFRVAAIALIGAALPVFRGPYYGNAGDWASSKAIPKIADRAVIRTDQASSSLSTAAALSFNPDP